MPLALLKEEPVPAPNPGWMALVKAVERLSAADDLPAIIEIIRATARNISGADGVCFVLRDGELCHYVEEYAIGPLWKGKRFPLTACISGWCMLNDKPAIVPDIYKDPRIPHDAYRPTFVKSLVMVPVKTSEPIAAIGSYWAQIRDFSEEEVALYEALGRAAAAAIAAAQLRETLRDRENRLAMALEAGGLGAWEFDLITATLITTPACKAIFGRELDEDFTADALLDAIHEDDRAAARRVFSPGPQPRLDTEYRVHCTDGERRIEMRGRVILDTNSHPAKLTGVVRDVTERHRAEERLEALRTEMVRNARLNDLGQMASALAHELNQPLAAASNYMHAAERLMGKDAGEAVTAIGKAEAQFVRAKEIIQRIRGFVGHRESTRAPEDVRSMIDDIVELAQTSPRWRAIPVNLDIADGLTAEVDRVQIQQVMLNLLRNAYEAVEPYERRQVTISAREAQGTIEIRLADNGPGLAPDIASHLFQPFHTTKRGGMGVGLSLCRRIVEAHEGRLWHEPSDPGATFCFTVPAVV
jgi:PAS domain S-box-containing protein